MAMNRVQCGADRVIPEKPDILIGLPHYISGLTIAGDSNMHCKNKICPLLGISLMPLTQGKYAIVDTSDYGYLSQWKWTANIKKGTWYAYRVEGSHTRFRKNIHMHRVIARTPDGLYTHHINGIRHDNRRRNVRSCTCAQNNYNRGSLAHTSRHKGVFWKVARKQWCAGIKQHGVNTFIGYYDDEDKAGRAYDTKAKELFGEFANLNFKEIWKIWGLR